MYSPGDAFGNEARSDVDRFLAAGNISFQGNTLKSDKPATKD